MVNHKVRENEVNDFKSINSFKIHLHHIKYGKRNIC